MEITAATALVVHNSKMVKDLRDYTTKIYHGLIPYNGLPKPGDTLAHNTDQETEIKLPDIHIYYTKSTSLIVSVWPRGWESAKCAAS